MHRSLLLFRIEAWSERRREALERAADVAPEDRCGLGYASKAAAGNRTRRMSQRLRAALDALTVHDDGRGGGVPVNAFVRVRSRDPSLIGSLPVQGSAALALCDAGAWPQHVAASLLLLHHGAIVLRAHLLCLRRRQQQATQ
jgi:hypothetical protein